MIFKNYWKNNILIKFSQDSRLRGNDDDLTISYFILGFAKVSGWWYFSFWLIGEVLALLGGIYVVFGIGAAGVVLMLIPLWVWLRQRLNKRKNQHGHSD